MLESCGTDLPPWGEFSELSLQVKGLECVCSQDIRVLTPGVPGAQSVDPFVLFHTLFKSHLWMTALMLHPQLRPSAWAQIPDCWPRL